MWNDYTTSNSGIENIEMPDSWHFYNKRENANRLTKVTSTGKKRAITKLYSWYENDNMELDKIEAKHIIIVFDGKAQAIIDIKKIDTIPFNPISTEYAARDMNTDIEPLKKWKKAHWTFFQLQRNRMERNLRRTC